MFISRRRHTPERIVRKLREPDRLLLGEGTELPEVWKHLEVSERRITGGAPSSAG